MVMLPLSAIFSEFVSVFVASHRMLFYYKNSFNKSEAIFFTP